MDIMQIFKDTLLDATRARCERHGLPSPDGTPASEDAHVTVAAAEEVLAGEE